MKLAEKLRKARGNRSYASIAEAVGCSPGNVRKIEAEDSQPGFVLGIRLAEVLGVPPDWLADDGADWPPPADDRQRAADLVRHALTRGGLADELNEEERELIANFRRLNDRRRGEAVGVLRTLANSLGGESPSRPGQKRDTDQIIKSG